MKKKLISIIVPVYNASTHLSKCVESLINQTYKNIEIILIDDGSKDDSYKICKEYSIKDKRIKVIHKENGGVSSARNFGLKVAKGDYIGFVDSDDYVEKNMYELLINSINQNSSQIAICNIYYETENKEQVYSYSTKDFIFSRHEFPLNIYNILSINGYTWNKLYDRGLIYRDNEFISFDENIGISEDSLFNYEIFDKNKEFLCSYIDEKMYHYIQEKNSVCNQRFTLKKLEHFIAREKEIDILKKNRLNSNFLKIDYVVCFCKTKILMKLLNTKKTELYNEVEKTNKKYLRSINFKKIPIKLKIKYLTARYFPFIYKLKIVLKKENL